MKPPLERVPYNQQNIPDYDVEHSEVLLYHIRVLEDLGEFSDALALLDTSAKTRAIIDRVAIMEFRGTNRDHPPRTNANSVPARLLSKSKLTDDAAHAWQALIQQNADKLEYYQGYFLNHGIDLGKPEQT